MCGCHSIPYNKFTKLITRSLVQDMITCLYVFPSNNAISNDLSPAAIVLGSPNPTYNKMNITFGAYAQFYIGITNSLKRRTVGAFAIRPANERGGYYFMLLANGKQLCAFIWTKLPINE